MQERRTREREPGRRERVQLDGRSSRLQQPRRVPDLLGDELARADREQAIPLNQPLLQRAALGRGGRANRLVARDKRPRKRADAVIERLRLLEPLASRLLTS
jgi:hypothetical protein